MFAEIANGFSRLVKRRFTIVAAHHRHAHKHGHAHKLEYGRLDPSPAGGR